VDIDDLIYLLIANSFPGYESGEVLDILENLKHPQGLDEPSEIEQEIWQKYLALKSQMCADGDGDGGGQTRTHVATEERGGSGGSRSRRRRERGEAPPFSSYSTSRCYEVQ
jgi:hypothetical protein